MATVGNDKHTFDVIYDWAKLPEDWDAPMAAVAVDSQDRVYGFNRGERGVIVFDSGGNYLSHWEGVDFVFPHAIYADPSDNIWIVDRDMGQILKYTPDGELLMTIGERDTAPTRARITRTSRRTAGATSLMVENRSTSLLVSR